MNYTLLCFGVAFLLLIIAVVYYRKEKIINKLQSMIPEIDIKEKLEGIEVSDTMVKVISGSVGFLLITVVGIKVLEKVKEALESATISQGANVASTITGLDSMMKLLIFPMLLIAIIPIIKILNDLFGRDRLM